MIIVTDGGGCDDHRFGTDDDPILTSNTIFSSTERGEFEYSTLFRNLMTYNTAVRV